MQGKLSSNEFVMVDLSGYVLIALLQVVKVAVADETLDKKIVIEVLPSRIPSDVLE